MENVNENVNGSIEELESFADFCDEYFFSDGQYKKYCLDKVSKLEVKNDEMLEFIYESRPDFSVTDPMFILIVEKVIGEIKTVNEVFVVYSWLLSGDYKGECDDYLHDKLKNRLLEFINTTLDLETVWREVYNASEHWYCEEECWMDDIRESVVKKALSFIEDPCLRKFLETRTGSNFYQFEMED